MTLARSARPIRPPGRAKRPPISGAKWLRGPRPLARRGACILSALRWS